MFSLPCLFESVSLMLHMCFQTVGKVCLCFVYLYVFLYDTLHLALSANVDIIE